MTTKKRQLTPEQIAKRDERRSRIRGMAKTIGKMNEEERAKLVERFLGVVTIEGRHLSNVNQMMLAMQLPSASVVGGFKQWLKAGRSVRKGEHGAGIWVPIGQSAENKETGLNETNEVTGFVIGTVFDVSQTSELESKVAA